MQPQPEYQLLHACSFFASVKSNEARKESLTFEQLYRVLTSEKLYANKTSCPLWKGAAFANDTKVEGSSIVEHSIVIGDYDGEQVPFADAVSRLEQLGITGCVYTTASHTPETPRWRVAVPLSRPVTPNEFEALVDKLNGAMSGWLQAESWVQKQNYYYGRVVDVPFESALIQGTRYLDQAQEIAGIPKPVKVPNKTEVAKQLSNKFELPPDGRLVEDLAKALVSLKELSRAEWIKFSYGMASLKGTPVEELARAAWLTWTKSSSKYKPDDDKTWATLTNARLQYPAIFEAALELGWVDTRPKPHERVIKYLSTLSQEDRLLRWAPLAAGLDAASAGLVLQSTLTKDTHKLAQANRELREARDEHKRFVTKREIHRRAGERTVVYLDKQGTALQAKEILEDRVLPKCRIGELVSKAGLPSYVAKREAVNAQHWYDPTLAVPQSYQVVQHTAATIIGLFERHVAFVQTNDRGGVTPICVPDPIVKQALTGSEVTLPVITGLINHPIVLPNGMILQRPGYDSNTGLYLTGPATGYRAYVSLEECRAGYDALCAMPVFKEFAFATERDRAQAVGVQLMYIQRSLWSKGPGVLYNSPAASSGKTSLAGYIHSSITGQELAINTLPSDDLALSKLLLSIGMHGSPHIVFDNLTTGSQLNSAELAKWMTAPVYSDRILGVSKTGSVPTNNVLSFTGNNVSAEGDIPTRLIQIQLDTRLANPTARKYSVTELYKQTLANRPETLCHLIGILGYTRNYLTLQELPPNNRFSEWDREVRHVMYQITGFDLGDIFAENLAASSDIAFLVALAKVFKKPLLVSEITSMLGEMGGMPPSGYTGDDCVRFREAFMLVGMPANKIVSSIWVGRKLKAFKNRICEWDGDNWQLQETAHMGGYLRWSMSRL